VVELDLQTEGGLVTATNHVVLGPDGSIELPIGFDLESVDRIVFDAL